MCKSLHVKLRFITLWPSCDKEIADKCKDAWSRYFQVLDERLPTKNRSKKAEKLAIFDVDIEKIKKEILLFQSTMKDLRAEADKAMTVAEKNKFSRNHYIKM